MESFSAKLKAFMKLIEVIKEFKQIKKIKGSAVLVIKEIKELKKIVKKWKKQNFTICLVPTMGYLHEGHLSLMKAARKNKKAKLIVSIFVNPMQFGANEDLATYPRDLKKDRALCKKEGVDLIFAPSIKQLYPANFKSFVDLNSLTDKLCGASRKGHFRGVCTVLTKLFNIITPNRAYFGQKDAQQFAIVKQMTRDLNMPIKLKLCPIIREEDGLAKSSRNVYLSKEERKAALVLSRAVFLGQRLIEGGERRTKTVKDAMLNVLQEESLARIDYVELVEANTIEELSVIKGDVLGAVAVYIGKTRLIDNFLLRGIK